MGDETKKATITKKTAPKEFEHQRLPYDNSSKLEVSKKDKKKQKKTEKQLERSIKKTIKQNAMQMQGTPFKLGSNRHSSPYTALQAKGLINPTDPPKEVEATETTGKPSKAAIEAIAKNKEEGYKVESVKEKKNVRSTVMDYNPTPKPLTSTSEKDDKEIVQSKKQVTTKKAPKFKVDKAKRKSKILKKGGSFKSKKRQGKNKANKSFANRTR